MAVKPNHNELSVPVRVRGKSHRAAWFGTIAVRMVFIVRFSETFKYLRGTPHDDHT